MRHEEQRRATSVLVIGNGAAGLRAAIELRQRGVDVTCVGKRRRDDAHTVLAASGINAALGTMDPEDSWEQHAADTLREAYGLAVAPAADDPSGNRAAAASQTVGAQDALERAQLDLWGPSSGPGSRPSSF